MSASLEATAKVKRAGESDRDQAAITLAGYITGILQFSPDMIGGGYRDGLIERVNKVRQTQGIKPIVLLETVPSIRAFVTPVLSQSQFEATEERLALLMKEPS
jgi:hypothetical protein